MMIRTNDFLLPLRQGARFLLTMATATIVAAGPAMARSAKGDYDAASECAAITQAGIPIPGQPADKAKVLVPYFAKQSASTGGAAGMTPRQIDADIAATRAQVAREWAGGKRSDRADLTKLAQDCAALPFFEAIAAAKHGK